MIYFVIYIIIAILVCMTLTIKDYLEVKDIFGDAPIFKLIEPKDFIKDNLVKGTIWPLYFCYVILGIVITFICSKL